MSKKGRKKNSVRELRFSGRWPTEAEINAKRTAKGGWLREDLAKWGVPWPPPSGWRKALINQDAVFFASGGKRRVRPAVAEPDDVQSMLAHFRSI